MRRVAILLLTVLAGALAGCGDAGRVVTVGDAGPSVERFAVAGQAALVAHPARPDGSAILFVHGAGENAESILDDPTRAPTVHRLLDAGYTIAASDAHGDAWGNAASVGDYVRLAARLRRQGFTRLYVIAQSMGGVAGTLLIDRIHPDAWAGIFPVCDVASVTHIKAVADEVAKAGPTVPRVVRARDVRGLRMVFWASPDDTIVDKTANADRCAAQARADGAQVKVVQTVGDHGDASNYRADQLMALFRGRRGGGG